MLLLAFPTQVLTRSGSMGNSQRFLPLTPALSHRERGRKVKIRHPRRSNAQGTATSLILQPYKNAGYANLLKYFTLLI